MGRIIVETQDNTKLLRDYIVGIGINVYLKKDERYEHIIEKWQEFCVNIGRRVNVRNANKEFAGIFQGISNNGELILLLDNGL